MKYLILFLLFPFMGAEQDSIPLTNHIYCLVGNELVKPSEDSVAYIQYHALIKTDWVHKNRTVYQYADKSVDGKLVTRLCIIHKKRNKWKSKIL